MKANYHTHTYLCCHAIGDVEDYVKAAINKGLKEIGISDHGPVPFEDYERRMNLESMEEHYLNAIHLCQEKYRGQIKIYAGLELEYEPLFPDYYRELLTKFDYFVLGQHFFLSNGKYIDIYESMNAKLIKEYTASLINAMRSGVFKFVAHPDIVFFAYRDWDEVCALSSKEIIDEAIKLDLPLEFNANGLRRKLAVKGDGTRYHQYPRDEFWKLVSLTKARVIINDDAHSPLNINDEYTKLAEKMAKKYRLNVIMKLDF